MIENRKFENAACFEGEVDAASVEKRLLECGCPADLAKKAALGAEIRSRSGVTLKTDAQIDADNRKRAAEIARQIAAEKF